MTCEFYRILTINSGSSSIKCSLYDMGWTEGKILAEQIERLGQRDGFFYAKDANGKSVKEQHLDLPDLRIALKKV